MKQDMPESIPFDPLNFPREYPGRAKWIILVLIGFLVLMGALFFTEAKNNIHASWGKPLGFIIFMMSYLIDCVFYRVVMHPDRIEVRSLFGAKTMLRSDMEGIRYGQRNVQYKWMFVSKNYGPRIGLRHDISEDAYFRGWVESMPKLSYPST